MFEQKKIIMIPCEFQKVVSILILSILKRNPLFLHEIEWKNNGFLFTTPNIIFSK